MDRRFLETVARELGAGRSRRQVLGTATKGLLGGFGAALVTGGAGTNRLSRPFATSVLAQDAAIEIKDFEFVPASLEVTVGTKVIWLNTGPSPHTATSDDGTSFDSGALDAGATFEQTFAAAGTFAYHCDFHPMKAQIVVKAGSPTPIEPYTRRNVHTLPAGDKTLETYATAVDKMKKLPDSDLRSWRNQANIHRFPLSEFGITPPQLPDFLTAPGHEGWFTCEHSPTRFFWPWHRMYLYWFERIVRDMSGNPAFALPYWDYSVATNRILPAPFLDSDSPLFTDLRDTNVNAGIAPSFSATRMNEIFDHCGGFREDSYSLASDGLEGAPHGGIHNWVGGVYSVPEVGGLMRSLNTSPRDPIFWLHHANMDRLWESWVQLGTTAIPHDNPPDTDWLKNDVNRDYGFDIPYNFFDETGTKVTTVRVVEQVVSLTALGYSYEALFDPAAAGCETSGGEVVPIATPAATPSGPEELGTNTPEGGIEIGADPVDITIPLDQPDLGPEAVAGGGEVILTLTGVEGRGVPGSSFEIYVNLPPDQPPDFTSIYFVGYLNLFGLQPWDENPMGADHGQHGVRRFNVARNVAALKAANQWTKDLIVKIVPHYEVSASSPEAAGATPAPPPSGPWVTVESITVTTQ